MTEAAFAAALLAAGADAPAALRNPFGCAAGKRVDV